MLPNHTTTRVFIDSLVSPNLFITNVITNVIANAFCEAIPLCEPPAPGFGVLRRHLHRTAFGAVQVSNLILSE